MDGVFTREQPVLPGLCDYRACLSVSECARLFMDIASYHAETLGIGYTGFEERGLFWVAVKTRIEMKRRVKMAEMLYIDTWPEEESGFKCNRDYEINDGKDVVVTGKTEWAIIESSSHKPQKAKDVYPSDIIFPDRFASPEPFAKLKGDFEGRLLGTYKVRSVDTDYGRHMNNVVYIKVIEGLFSCEELDSLDFMEFEIHYKNPCFEGETITFYGEDRDGYLEIKAVNDEGKIIVLARLK
ncbi:MAG: hypothetical protein K5776_02495 [Lachnospiraceae bacterium]|nr:hypothetical protein [Lachnospiraceae bacterium]